MREKKNSKDIDKVIRKKVKFKIRKRNNCYEKLFSWVIFIHAFLVLDTFPTKKQSGTSSSTGSFASRKKMNSIRLNLEPDSSNSLLSSFAANSVVSAFIYECI